MIGSKSTGNWWVRLTLRKRGCPCLLPEIKCSCVLCDNCVYACTWGAEEVGRRPWRPRVCLCVLGDGGERGVCVWGGGGLVWERGEGETGRESEWARERVCVCVCMCVCVRLRERERERERERWGHRFSSWEGGREINEWKMPFSGGQN